MKRNLFLILLVLLSNFAISLSGNLIFNKTNLVQNESFTIKYFDTDKIFKDKAPDLYIYAFNRNSTIPTGYNVQSGTFGDSYSYSFKVPSDAVFILFKLGDGKVFDFNKGNMWDFIVKRPDSIDIKDGNYLSGLSYLSASKSKFSRIPDFKKVLNYFNKEVELYPDNIKAQIALLSLNFELSNLEEKEFNNKMENLLGNSKISIDNEEEIEVVLKALRLLGKTDRADKIKMKFIKSNPNSRIAIEHAFESLSKIEDFDTFINKSQVFLKKYPKSDYTEKLNLAIIQSFIQKRKFIELIDLLNNSDIEQSDIYTQVAENLLKNDLFINALSVEKRLESASELIEKGKQQILKFGTESPGLTPNENQMLEQTKQVKYLSMKSNIFLEEGKIAQVDSIYSILIKDLKFIDNDLLDDMSTYYYKYNNYENLLKITEYSYLYNSNTDSLGILNSIAYKAIYPSYNYNNYADSLKNEKQKFMLTNYINNFLKIKIELPSVKSLENQPISLKVFQGRIIVFYAFAFWCDDCWDAFDEIDKLYNNFRENENVVIFPVILWSKDKNDIDETIKFREKNKLDIQVYFDLMNETYRNFSITGVPTVMIVNRENEVIYRSEGLAYNNSTIKDIYLIIDNLAKGE